MIMKFGQKENFKILSNAPFKKASLIVVQEQVIS